MATPQLDFDPYSDGPAKPAGNGAAAATKAPALDFDPWSDGPAANDAPAPDFSNVQSKVISTEEKPGFGKTFMDAMKRGGASAIASTAHTIADTIDQTVQAPVRQVTQALFGKGAAADAFVDPLGARGAAETNLGIEREINTDRVAAAERIGDRPTAAEWKGAPGDAARRTALRLTHAAGESVPLLAAAVATRNPAAGAALMGGASGAQEYTDLREDGVERITAAQAGLLTGAIEAAGEGVGLPAVMGKAGRGSIARAALTEGAQEAPVSVAQQNVDDQARGRETSVGDQLMDALDAALVGGALGAGAHVAGAQRGGAERQPSGRGDDVPRGNDLPPEALALPSPDRTPDFGVIRVAPDGSAVTQAQAAQAAHPGFARTQSDPTAYVQSAPAVPFPDATPGGLADASNALPSGPATWEQRQADIAWNAHGAQQQRQRQVELDALARDSRLPVALQDAAQADALRRATGADDYEAAPNAMQLAMQRAQGEADATRVQAATMRATAQGPLTRVGADALDQRANQIEAGNGLLRQAHRSEGLQEIPNNYEQSRTGFGESPTPITGQSGLDNWQVLPQGNEVSSVVTTENSKKRVREEVRPAFLPNRDRYAHGEAFDYVQRSGEYQFDNEAGAARYAAGLEAGEGGKWQATEIAPSRWRAVRQADTAAPTLDFDPFSDTPAEPTSILYGKHRQQATQGANPEATARAEARIARMFGEETQASDVARNAVGEASTSALDFDPFQDSPSADGLRRDHAERLVRRYTKGLPNHPQVVLVDNAEALHRAAGVQPDVDGVRAEGLYNGKPAVFINSAAIDSPKRFRQVLAHEALGHVAVEQVVGEQWPHIAKTIIGHIENGTGAPWMRKAIAQVQASQPDVTDPLKLAKEVVAVMAEHGSRNGMINTVIARTRSTLRQAIPSVKWTDADVRDLLSQAEGYLRGRKPQAPLLSEAVDAASNAGVQYSKPGEAPADTAHVASQFGHVTDKQRTALGKIATFQRPETLSERAAHLTENLRAKVIQGTVDQFHAFKDLDETAYMQARLSRGTDGAVEGVFRYGTPKLTDGALDIQADGKGFLGHLQELQGEHDLFLAWVAGHRSEQLATEGREHLFTPADIASLKELAKGRMADGRNREATYRHALQALNRYQKAILDIAEEAGEINATSRARWQTDFYLPFFRDMSGSPAPAPHPHRGSDNPGDIAEMRKQVIERLVGGGQPLNDLLENTLQNWGRILAASMRNMAATRALKAATEIGVAKPVPAADRGTVSAMFKGERKHFQVDDPLVLESLVMLYAPPWSNPAMKALQWFKRALTFGVTIDPSFRVRNLMRDTLSVIASNTIGYNPLRNLAQGWKATERGGDTFLKLLGGGGAIRFGSVLDGDQAAHAKRLIQSGLATDAEILDTPAKAKAALGKAWDLYQELGDRAEMVNRAALYEQARAAGKDHLEASYTARDTLDFTNAGAWTAVQFLTRTVPFMNARLQGLYKLGRSAKREPRRFAAVAGAVAMASVLLHLVNADDDDYRALPDWARDSYWWVKLPGTEHALYIPKPFEIGALASVAERGTELMTAGDDYQAKDFAHTLLSILSQQLSMNPIPQAVRPAMEAAFNRNTFQDRPIDGMGQERLPAEDRYTARTSGGAVALGKATGISPQRIEHMMRGYFGWLGMQALNVSDLMTRDVLDLGSNPTHNFGKADNIAVIGSFIRERDAGSSKYVQRFYDQQKQVDMLYAAYAAARQVGDLDRARELAGDDRLKLRGLYQAADREMTKINRSIRQVTNDKRLSADAKGELLGGLYGTRDRLAERATRRARQVQKEER